VDISDLYKITCIVLFELLNKLIIGKRVLSCYLSMLDTHSGTFGLTLSKALRTLIDSDNSFRIHMTFAT